MRAIQAMFAVVLGVGSVALVAAPADAAAKPCYSGSWVLTSQKGDYRGSSSDGDGSRVTWTGAAGTRLKLSGRSAAFDFARSKPEHHTEMFVFRTAKQRTTYRKSLRVGVRFTGSAKGRFKTAPKTAKGPATYRVTYTVPDDRKLSGNLAKAVRGGTFDTPIVPSGSYTCTKKKLTFTFKRSSATTSILHKAVYRRA